MDVKDAINQRRAYRSLEEVEITEGLISDLAESARIAPSCFNHQPWRFVFVYEDDMLKRLHDAFSDNNAWAKSASMVIAVFSRKDFDCMVGEREYFLLDCGIATAFIILRATELGLVAHPIAGFNGKKVKKIIEIPEEMLLITLIIVGKHSKDLRPVLSEKQKRIEMERPVRLPVEKMAYVNRYSASD
jgi:nitroreductase